jgi:hypothetical protein
MGSPTPFIVVSKAKMCLPRRFKYAPADGFYLRDLSAIVHFHSDKLQQNDFRHVVRYMYGYDLVATL